MAGKIKQGIPGFTGIPAHVRLKAGSGGVDEEWDDYLSRLNSMGLEEYMEIYQRNYSATH